MARIEIAQSGEILVSPSDADTFKDLRIPIHERLGKLAILMGSDEFPEIDQWEAESLLKEAALRLEPSRSVNEHRHQALGQAAARINYLQAENSSLRELNAGLEAEVHALNQELMWNLR